MRVWNINKGDRFDMFKNFYLNRPIIEQVGATKGTPPYERYLQIREHGEVLWLDTEYDRMEN